MTFVKQDCCCKLIQDKKTVDWLVSHTYVMTFDNINFVGYQRKVNDNHVSKIVDYLNSGNFYMPTSIICASDEEVKDDTRLRIVDGQHRIEAFKKLKLMNQTKYQDIKDYELPVIILEKPTEELEVDTFITINKTSRKVDTSLAYVLKNKIARGKNNSDDLSIAKKDFLAVELCIDINNDANSIWYKKILLDDNPTQHSYETISLNSFVKSTRVLISYLEKYQIIYTLWSDEKQLNLIKDRIRSIYLFLWDLIKNKWPSLIDNKSTIIQGNIGVSSINKYIILQLKTIAMHRLSPDEFYDLLRRWIMKLDISEDLWLKGGEFSKYSSESGFNIIASKLFYSYKE